MGKVKKYIRELWTFVTKREMRVLPGNIAFFFMLSLVPIFTIIVYVASYFSISVDSVVDFITKFFPGDSSGMIIDIISGRGFDGHVGLFNLATIMIATNGTYSIINASNTLYNVKDSDHLRDRIKSVILFLIILILILFILIVPIFGDKILSLCNKISLFDYISNEIIIIFNIIKWPVSILIIYFNVKLIYTISPSTYVKSSETTNGALFTTVGWTLATAIFSFYLKYFASYDIIYGNLSSIIIIMMWLYILAYVFVLGMAINTSNWDN